ncbi:hypothetical protein F511_46651 [Dorcoceras hygrometricum]|uniref:Uncharacterized protein n=1 Tax=Dorcoceras hygrometricum TaxID=472368 RepID=A0A2Z6ZZT0_9LAMI|nr:hypothetical protein F511_46651 [Dorcoceras hygrometricum]
MMRALAAQEAVHSRALGRAIAPHDCASLADRCCTLLRRLCDDERALSAAVGAAVRRAWRDVAHGSRAIFSCGGRRPAAAPAMLRRCRDGWSEFF